MERSATLCRRALKDAIFIFQSSSPSWPQPSFSLYWPYSALSCSVAFGSLDSQTVSLLAYRLSLQTLLHLGLASFFVMTAVLIKQTGPTVAVNICLLIFVTAFLSVGSAFHATGFNPLTIWIAEALSSLEFDTVSGLVVLQALALMVVYILLPTLAGIAVFKKRDIM